MAAPHWLRTSSDSADCLQKPLIPHMSMSSVYEHGGLVLRLHEATVDQANRERAHEKETQTEDGGHGDVQHLRAGARDVRGRRELGGCREPHLAEPAGG